MMSISVKELRRHHEHDHEHDLEHEHTHDGHSHSHGPDGSAGAHGHTHTHQNTKAVLNRLSKLNGHLNAVKHMVEEGARLLRGPHTAGRRPFGSQFDDENHPEGPHRPLHRGRRGNRRHRHHRGTEQGDRNTDEITKNAIGRVGARIARPHTNRATPHSKTRRRFPAIYKDRQVLRVE